MRKVIVGANDAKIDGKRGESIVIPGGTKGVASVEFDGVAVALDGGIAKVSKRGAAVVLDGGPVDATEPDAQVGDGAVAMVLKKGVSSCFQSAIASSVQQGSVRVHGRGSLGVVLDPELRDAGASTGMLPKAFEGQSLLLFAHRVSDTETRWVIGVTGDPGDTLVVQGHLECGVPYRLVKGKFVKA